MRSKPNVGQPLPTNLRLCPGGSDQFSRNSVAGSVLAALPLTGIDCDFGQ